MELSDQHKVFVGFKLDGGLRRQLESLEGPDRKYVAAGESEFLTLCRLGGDHYVGKVVDDVLTTDRVDDVRRNVLSIVRRLCPDVRLPDRMDILVCLPGSGGADGTADQETKEKPPFEGFQ